MDCRLDNGWQGMQSCHTDSRLIVFAGQAIARLAGPLGVAGLFAGQPSGPLVGLLAGGDCRRYY